MNIGKKIVIGSQFSEALRYKEFVGCKGLIVHRKEDKYIVRLTEVTEDRLEPYINEHMMIHIDDGLEIVETPEATSIEESILHADREMLKVGSFIRIGSNFAEKMDYTECIGEDAIIQYKGESYVQALVVTGDKVGSIKDIHMEDCFVMPDEITEEGDLAIVLDHDIQTIFYGRGHRNIQLLSRVKSKVRNHYVHTGMVHSLSSLLDKHGYVAIHVEDTPWAKEAM